MDMAPNPVPSMEINTEGKILWVSANPESQVGEILRGMEGTPADHVASSLECYEAVRTGSYCAIVAEFPLPGCSPDELLEEVQRVDSSLPVLIFDAQGGFSDVVRLTKAGAQHFFGAGFDPDEFTDRYEDALRALIEEKKRGHKITRVEEPEDTTNVVDLMAALKKSLSAGTSKSGTKKSGSTASVSKLSKAKSRR